MAETKQVSATLKKKTYDMLLAQSERLHRSISETIDITLDGALRKILNTKETPEEKKNRLNKYIK